MVFRESDKNKLRQLREMEVFLEAVSMCRVEKVMLLGDWGQNEGSWSC